MFQELSEPLSFCSLDEPPSRPLPSRLVCFYSEEIATQTSQCPNLSLLPSLQTHIHIFSKHWDLQSTQMDPELVLPLQSYLPGFSWHTMVQCSLMSHRQLTFDSKPKMGSSFSVTKTVHLSFENLWHYRFSVSRKSCFGVSIPTSSVCITRSHLRIYIHFPLLCRGYKWQGESINTYRGAHGGQRTNLGTWVNRHHLPWFKTGSLTGPEHFQAN